MPTPALLLSISLLAFLSWLAWFWFFRKRRVAASAVIPLFGFPGWRYRHLNEVLLYPDTFDEDYQVQNARRNIIGMVGSGAMNRIQPAGTV